MTKSNQMARNEGTPDQRNLPYALGGLEGILLFATWCQEFYTAKKLPTDLPSSWIPWGTGGDLYKQILILEPRISDGSARELCVALAAQARILEDLNEEWNEALARFFGLPAPRTEREFRRLRQRADDYRTKRGPEWAIKEEFLPLVAKVQQTVEQIAQIWLKLEARLKVLYPGKFLTPEELGDQRAKDIIDRAYEVDAESAIRLLDRALRYGHTGIQARKAYEELGSRYEQLGDKERAIENYTKSLEAWREPGWVSLLNRGKLYYAQQRWQEARADLERALTIEWLPSDERKEAQSLLAKIADR